MWRPRDNSAGRSPSLLQALGSGHLGEVLAQGPSFEAVLAQSPGSALPQLLSGDHHLRSVVLLRRSLLQRSAQRLHAGLRAAAGRGHRAAHVVRVKGRWGGGCARGAAAGMDAGRMPGPAPRPSEAGGGALQQSGLPLPRGAAGTELCRLRASVCGRTDKAEQRQQPFFALHLPFIWFQMEHSPA